MASLKEQLATLKHGDHIAMFYQEDEEAAGVAATFIKQGLQAGERCHFILGEHSVDQVTRHLEAVGVAVEEEIERGALVLQQQYAVLYRDGHIDFTGIHVQLQQLIDQAITQGYKGFRLMSEMTWALAVEGGSEWLVAYEALGNHLLDESPFLALCAYDRRKFDPAVLQAMLHTHPYVLIEDAVCPNLYFERPDLVMDSQAISRRLDWMLSQLARAHHAEEEHLRRVREETARVAAEEAQRQLQQFLGMVTHELGNALATITANAQVIRHSAAVPLDEKLQRRFEALEVAERRVRRLLSDLGDAAHIGNGGFVVQREPMDLVTTARQVVEVQSAAQRTILLDAPDKLIGQWDRERVSQVLVNLISNALKYSPPDTAVHVRLYTTGKDAMIQVSDQGQGILPERIPQLFQPFTRLADDRNISGTGLGLFISKNIVEAHGGRIWLESELGKGTTFFVALPLEETVPSPATSAQDGDVLAGS